MTPAQLRAKAARGFALAKSCARVAAQLGPRCARIVKNATEGEERYTLGIALEPDVVDAHNETYDAETIREAAFMYLAKYRNTDLQHQQLINHAVELVESYIAPADMTIGNVRIKKGTWLVGHRILDDEIWALIKAGKITGLSISGTAMKEDAETGRPMYPEPGEERWSG